MPLNRRNVINHYRSIVSAIVLLLAACSAVSEVTNFDGGPVAPGALERRPYLVAVTDSSAIVRWRTFEPSTPNLRFWGAGDTIPVPLPGPATDHTVLLKDLSPATPYTYQVQTDDLVWTGPATFRTFSSPGTKDPFTFLVFGDSGTLNAGQLAVAQQLNNENPALILHTGDLAYKSGTENELTHAHFRIYAPLVSRAPLYPTPGDHDLKTRMGQPYITAFTPPAGWASGSPFYHAFDYGNARFIALDTKESDRHDRLYGSLTDTSGKSYQWLVGQLEAARSDPGVDWIFVFFHHAPYSAATGFGGHGSDDDIQDVIAPLADEYGVNFVFSGHDHDYQRSRSLRGDEIVQDGYGTVYVVSGGGGGRRTFRGTGSEWFTAYAEQVYHYVRVHVNGYTTRLEAVDTEGSVIDSYTVSLPLERRKTLEPGAVPAAQ
jgi:3',5'-cyclic AMP phosphodiesterase CpdA